MRAGQGPSSQVRRTFIDACRTDPELARIPAPAGQRPTGAGRQSAPAYNRRLSRARFRNLPLHWLTGRLACDAPRPPRTLNPARPPCPSSTPLPSRPRSS
jgi:hypothetical protein